MTNKLINNDEWIARDSLQSLKMNKWYENQLNAFNQNLQQSYTISLPDLNLYFYNIDILHCYLLVTGMLECTMNDLISHT